MEKEFQILLYYKYVHIENPDEVMAWQREICQELGMTGRIIIAQEGINGTAEGTKENTEEYIKRLQADPRFADINFKRSFGTGNAFPKLSIKLRSEIVGLRLGEKDINPNQITGKYLGVEELHDWFERGEEFYIVDMRNDYEHASGHFVNSILPKLTNFRDLPDILADLSHLKDKKVLTVCTGGVRCEKASGFLVANGFSDVYQLKDGIVSYMERYPNQHFLGKLYVFDNRILMGFNTNAPEHVVVGRCVKCNKPEETYTNCAYSPCHLQLICCDECLTANNGTIYCSAECELNQKNLVDPSIIHSLKLAGI